MEKKVGICGHFGFGKELLNGQTIKTKNIEEALCSTLGSEQILKVDTHGGIKSLPRITIQTLLLFKKCKNIIVLPAHNGLLFFTPLFLFFNILFHRKIHYIVIGGWLDSYIAKHLLVSRMLKKFNCIYVETSTMKNALLSRGFENIIILPNFKKLKKIDESELVVLEEPPYRLCTFSRVMKQKGIEDVVKAVIQINKELNVCAYYLDIYGQIDEFEIDWFDQLKESFPDYIKYKGTVESNKSVEVIKNYFALVFPTRFYTEGIPGTIIDAYSAGVPVISARWESYEDLVLEGITGLGYSFGQNDELLALLKRIYLSPALVNNLKYNCLKQSKRYSPENVISILISNLR